MFPVSSLSPKEGDLGDCMCASRESIGVRACAWVRDTALPGVRECVRALRSRHAAALSSHVVKKQPSLTAAGSFDLAATMFAAHAQARPHTCVQASNLAAPGKSGVAAEESASLPRPTKESKRAGHKTPPHAHTNMEDL
jgi:hypothetical protein